MTVQNVQKHFRYAYMYPIEMMLSSQILFLPLALIDLSVIIILLMLVKESSGNISGQLDQVAEWQDFGHH